MSVLPGLAHELRQFAADESGATAIEYGLIAALIALAIITGARSIGTTVNAKLLNISTKIGTTTAVP